MLDLEFHPFETLEEKIDRLRREYEEIQRALDKINAEKTNSNSSEKKEDE